MNKANLEIYRTNNIVHIRIVDRINSKTTEVHLSPNEFGLLLTGLFNNDNCVVNYREIENV